ncbi:class I SAM-dependent methyltransferase, partial [bacterium]
MNYCRFCGSELTHVFCDLGFQPPSNSLLTNLEEPETYYPLKVYVCTSCWLVQLPEVKEAGEIFTDDYPYYSSQSPSNVSHAKEYVEMMCDRFGYGEGSQILEIGSNDGYMLQHFIDKGCSVQGVDPARGPADEAILKGIPTVKVFFQKKRIDNFYPADLICSINTIAHQPDINDFVAAMKMCLKPKGVITAEFPHLMRLVEGNQFDTIYHEHFSYFSLTTLERIFSGHNSDIFDVDEIPEHGGSLRIYARHKGRITDDLRVIDLMARERKAGMSNVGYYEGFQKRVEDIRRDLMRVLMDSLWIGHVNAAYGAAAKGSTLLNYCGIRSDLVPVVADRSPHKIGKFLPGSHIRIMDPRMISERRPDRVLILPWNLKDEIM